MRTKIVCTIGPASQSKTKLKKMIEAGMTVGRINFSHGTHQSNGQLIASLRRAAAEAGEYVGIMADLQGPRIRVAQLPEPIVIKEGGTVYLYEEKVRPQSGPKSRPTRAAGHPLETSLGVDSSRLLKHLQRGDSVYVDNGMMELEVIGKKGSRIKTKVRTAGTINSRKGLNIPRISEHLPAFTAADRVNLEFALSQNVDFVAMSFVKAAKDIASLRKTIKRMLPGAPAHQLPGIVAKIETSQAVKNFDEIVKLTDAVMIARGDLAIEMPLEKIPDLQKSMIEKCLHNAKPAIVATQMLESMMENPRPTRAEITDVANAVIDHADAIMLSGESALGKYPVKTVRTMKKIATHTEVGPYDDVDYRQIKIKELIPFSFIARAAVALAHELNLKNIIIRNAPLAMTHKVARFRPEINIWHLARTKNEARRLSLVWGVKAVDQMKEIKGGYVLIDGVSQEHGKIEYQLKTQT